MEFCILGIGKYYEQWLSQYLSSFRILDVDERNTVHYSAVRTALKKAGNPNSIQMMLGFELYAGSIPCRFSAAPSFRRCTGITRLEW